MNVPFYIIVIFISFIASIAGLALVKENRTPRMFFFTIFLLSSLLVEYFGWKMSSHNGNTIALYNYFTLFEFCFYLLFMRTAFSNMLIRRIIIFVVAGYFIFTVINIFYIQGKNNFHSHTYVLGCTLIVIFSIVYFNSIFRHPETGSLTRNSHFWITTGLMFYYTCTFSLYGLENFITKTIQQYNTLLFFIGDLLNILLYTLFSIGVLCKINTRKLLRLS